MPSFATSMFRRIKVHFSRSFVGKHHPYVLCKYDAVIKLRSLVKDLIQDKELVEVTTPVGRKPKCDFVLTRASLHVREISLALVNMIRQMHDSGYSLDGCLTLSMLYWIPSTKSVKVGGLRKGDIQKLSSLRATQDFHSIDALIRNEIFVGEPIPEDLKAWLFLLKDDPLSNLDLISKNMFLLEDEAKVAEYMIIFQKLQQVKGMSPDLYATAMSYILAGHHNGECLWQAFVLQSYVLEKLKNYNVPPNPFVNTVESLVLFARHGCHHLTEGSVKIVFHNNVEVVTIFIKVSDIYAHIETFLPGLFAQVQKGFYVARKMLKEANLPMP